MRQKTVLWTEDTTNYLTEETSQGVYCRWRDEETVGTGTPPREGWRGDLSPVTGRDPCVGIGDRVDYRSVCNEPPLPFLFPSPSGRDQIRVGTTS